MKIKNILFGFVIGAIMMVPGVSGGSAAVLLGIYDDIVSAFATLFKKFKESFKLLFSVALGGIVGFVLVSRLAKMFLNLYYAQAMYLFIGIVLCGLVYQIKIAVSRHGRISIVAMAIGAVAVTLIKYLPVNSLSFMTENVVLKLISFLFVGVLLAVALVLPGISFSLMLVILGEYDRFVSAVNEMDLVFLLPLATSVLFGVVVSTGALHRCMKKYPLYCQSTILGFVLASVLQMYPGIYFGGTGLVCLVLLLLGFFAPMIVLKKMGKI